MGRLNGGTRLPGLAVLFCSCLACLYVAGRLWGTTRTVHFLQTQLEIAEAAQRDLIASRQRCRPAVSTPGAEPAQQQSAPDSEVLHYSIRSSTNTVALPPLSGPTLDDDGAIAEQGDDSLLGAIDWVEAGEVRGWACLRNEPNQRIEVLLYVDGVKVGQTSGGEKTPHLLINRLCEGETSESDGSASRMLGFRHALPPLTPGRHEVRAFVRRLEDSRKQELNQSPLPFMETPFQSDAQQAVARKDAIIRVRNAQVSTLWDELHTRQPWRTATNAGKLSSFGVAGANGTDSLQPKYLAVIAVNTGFGARHRRDMLRKSWVPTGKALTALQERGIVIRFIVGRSDQTDDPMDKKVRAETKEFGDILRLDSTDTYADLAHKTLKLFSKLPDKFDASFYFKVDDDIIVNVDALETYLQERRHHGNLYMGCMKSGGVLTDRKYKWFEPDAWRFGDGQNGDMANYMRHASGQFYGVSAPVARYIKQNAPILHRYANEDITVGTWMLGLDVDYVNERRMCCANEEECEKLRNADQECLGFFEMACAGICNSEQRLPKLYQDCVVAPRKQRWGSHRRAGAAA